MRPKDYTVQDGCYNCERIFIYSEYDEGYTYYCQYRSRKRPLCGSVAMNEYFYKDTDQDGSNKYYFEVNKNRRKWERWSENRWVKPWGKCPKYKKKI